MTRDGATLIESMTSFAVLIAFAVKASIFLNVLALGMSARPGDALYLLRRPALLVRSVFAMNVLMPVFAVALTLAFDLPPVVKIALLALAVSPVPPMLPHRELKAGGHASYTIGLLAAAALLAIVLTPLTITVLGRILDKEAHAPVGRVAALVTTSVLAPLAVGLTVRRLSPGTAARLARPVFVAGSIILAAGSIPILVSAWPTVAVLIGNGTLVALAAFSLVGLAAGHILGGPDPGQRTVLALSTASRHPAIALTSASANFSEPKPVMGTILLYLIVSALISVLYVRARASRGGTGVGGGVEVRTSERAPTLGRAAS
jgi:bile acid:Na+ symporter, BASS family